MTDFVMSKTSQDLSKAEVRKQLEIADRDISYANAWLSGAVDSSDLLVRIVGKMVLSADHDSKVAYEELLTGTYYDVNKNYEDWAKSQGIDVGNMKKRNAPIIDQKTMNIATGDGIYFVTPDSKEGKAIMAKPDGHPLKEYYKVMVLDYVKAQEVYPKMLRPGYRIPTIAQSILETTLEGDNKVKRLGNRALDTIRKTTDDIDRRATDENGNPIEFLPIRFVSKQDGKDGRFKKSDVSLDIASTTLAFRAESYRTEKFKPILNDLELAKYILETREVTETRRVSLLTDERVAKVDEFGKPITKSGVESNAFIQVDQFLKRMVYGQIKDEGYTIDILGLKIDTAKVADAIIKYTGLRFLALNVNVAAANFITGEATILKEAIGGNHFNLKGYWNGKKRYMKEIVPTMAEIGKRRKTTKFALMMNYMNIQDHYRSREDLGMDTTKLKTMLDFSNINFMADGTDIEMRASVMFAMMDKFKVTLADGTEVDLYEAYDAKNGQLHLKDGVTKDGKPLTQKEITKFRNKVIKVNEDILGVYNTINSGAFKGKSIGRMVMVMRNWLKPGLDARWKLKYYDERLTGYNEGHYISAINFFRETFGPNSEGKKTVERLKYLFAVGLDNANLLTQAEKDKLSIEDQQSLTEVRKANIKKTVVELYIMMGISLLSALAFDDDDDEEISAIHYFLLRLKNELRAFSSPTTAWEILNSPSVTLAAISDSFDFIYDLTVNSGINAIKGKDIYEVTKDNQYKIINKLEKQIPIWNQRNQFNNYSGKIDWMKNPKR